MARPNPFAGKQAAPFPPKGGAKGKAKGNPFAKKADAARDKAKGIPEGSPQDLAMDSAQGFKKGGRVKKK